MKKYLTRILAIAVMLVFVLVMVTACGGAAKETTAAETTAAETTVAVETTAALKDVSFTYATFIGDAEKDMVGICIKPFTAKYPNVKIETQVFEHATYQEKLPIMAKSNTLPDMFWWNSAQLVDAYKNTQSIVDLTPYIDDEFKKDFNSIAFTAHTTPDGKIVGFPAETGAQGMMYNKALFDQLGLQIPKTFDELKEVVKVFKKNNIVAISMGTKDNWPTWQYENWFQMWGTKEIAKDLFDTGAKKVTDPAGPYSIVLNKIGELAELGAFPSNASTMNYEQVVALFTSGKAAMVSIPTDQFAKVLGTPVEKDVVFNWGITFPDAPEASRDLQAFGCSNAYGVGANAGKDADKMAAIIEFNKYRYSEEGFTTTLKTGAVLPCVYKVDLSSMGSIMQGYGQMIAQIGDGTVKGDVNNPTNAYTYYRTWDSNWEAFGSKWNAAYSDGILLGLFNGSVKKADLAGKLAKAQTTLDGIIKAWKATK